jgi:excinuclease UvrABC nuclease subunit
MKSFPFLKEFRPCQGASGGFLLNKDDISGDTRHNSGVYVIESADGFKFPYPKGRSNVLYIGKADNLHSRLMHHWRRLKRLIESKGEYGMEDDEPWVSSKYQYMFYHGAKVYYYKCQRTQEAKELEARVLWAFYSKYRALPVGNGAKSYSKK